MVEEGACAQRLIRRVILALLALTAAHLACAHHSFARYDSDIEVKLSGSVTMFSWGNPHVYIGLAVREERGTLNTYILECASPAILERQGWRSNMIRAGDRITVIVAPLRTGDPGGLVKELTTPDGRRFSGGALVGRSGND
jgi:hypothetical protein